MTNNGFISVIIEIKNFWGTPRSDAEVFLKNVKTRHGKVFRKVTDNDGKVKFSRLQKGKYLVHITNKKSIKEEVYEFANNSNLKFRIGRLLPWLREIKLIPDSTLCSFCRCEYESFADKFKCKYCECNFCSEDRIPENHDCFGRPRSIPAEYRTIYSKGRTRYEKI